MQEQHKHIDEVIKTVWQKKDFELLRSSLADGLVWFESSFSKSLVTPNRVIAQWEDDLAKQSQIKVDVQLLDYVENRGYHHCSASWRDAKDKEHLVDAIFVIHLNLEGKIVYFMPWYTSKS